ncbi:MAG: hypothetical protein RL136_2526 [Planctomycetota bacterium]|jgi:hypothetical protein
MPLVHPRAFLRSAAVAASGLLVVASAGCTTRTQTFEGFGETQLWPAMVATARTPSYDDWKVLGNEVYADDERRIIEVYRTLRRTYYSPEAEPLAEERQWRFQIVLGDDPERLAPSVAFTARQFAVPAHVWDEADRYFLQVRRSLVVSDGTGSSQDPGTEAPDFPAAEE